MAQPNPAMRIPPSGPPVAGTTSPFNEYAGAIFRGQNSSDASDEIIGSIGPAGGGSASLTVARAAIGPDTVPQLPGPDAEAFPLNGSAELSEYVMGVGTWLVEAEIGAGYNTGEAPTAAHSGDLLVSFTTVKDDNTPGPDTQAARTPLPTGDPGTGTGFRSATVQALLEITPADIADNGDAPLKGMQVSMQRVDGTNAVIGPYDASSGTLRFTNDFKLTIKRMR